MNCLNASSACTNVFGSSTAVGGCNRNALALAKTDRNGLGVCRNYMLTNGASATAADNTAAICRNNGLTNNKGVTTIAVGGNNVLTTKGGDLLANALALANGLGIGSNNVLCVHTHGGKHASAFGTSNGMALVSPLFRVRRVNSNFIRNSRLPVFANANAVDLSNAPAFRPTAPYSNYM